jgi:hypothetical protein
MRHQNVAVEPVSIFLFVGHHAIRTPTAPTAVPAGRKAGVFFTAQAWTKISNNKNCQMLILSQ